MIGKDVGGRYRIISKLGEGGMGAVYRAEQISLKRQIALKVLKPELSASKGLVRRFNAEAELAAKLNHPNTVTLYDFGQDDDGFLFIAMEFIAGRSLREVLVEEGPQPTDRIAAIGMQICSSLADAHATGIVHRDLKPDNVMLSERGKKTDVVTVLDFGIAKLRDEEGNITQQPMTRAGDMLGTPQYMAPEQIRGDRVDARTDVYALGIILYEMVTARLPFHAKTIMALLSMHLTEPPIPPHRRRTDIKIDPALELLIMQCLAKGPQDRPATMDAVEDALSAIGSASGPISGNAGPPLHQPPPAEAGMHSYAPASGQAATALPESGQAFTGPPASVHGGTPLPHSATPPLAGRAPLSHARPEAPSPLHQTGNFSASSKRSSQAGLWILLAVVLLGLGGGVLYLMGAQQTEKGRLEDKLLAGGESFTHAQFGYVVDLPNGFKVKEEGTIGTFFAGLANNVEMTILTAAIRRPGRFYEDETLGVLDVFLLYFELSQSSVTATTNSAGQVALYGRVSADKEDIAGDFVLLREGEVFYFVAIGCQRTSLGATRSFRRKFLQRNFQTPGG